MTDSQENIIEKTPKKELLELLRQMLRTYEKLPYGAKLSPVSHSDLESLLLLFLALFESD